MDSKIRLAKNSIRSIITNRLECYRSEIFNNTQPGLIKKIFFRIFEDGIFGPNVILIDNNINREYLKLAYDFDINKNEYGDIYSETPDKDVYYHFEDVFQDKFKLLNELYKFADDHINEFVYIYGYNKEIAFNIDSIRYINLDE